MEKKQQILIIHGGDTFATYDEYLKARGQKTVHLERMLSKAGRKDKLQEQLGSDFLVYQPQFPNKQNAQYAEWKLFFEKIIAQLEEGLILIGHSLGASFLVKYLSENKIPLRIAKTHLLGTPFDDDMEGDKLNSFLRTESLEGLAEQAGKLFFYHSEDDFAVPFSHFEKYQAALPEAHFRAMKTRNHFIQACVPELLVDLLEE